MCLPSMSIINCHYSSEEDELLKVDSLIDAEFPLNLLPAESHIGAFRVSFSEVLDPGCSLVSQLKIQLLQMI